MANRRRYTVDTNLYIDGMRTDTGRTGLLAFHAAYAPFEFLTAVVAQELLAGAHGRAARVLDEQVIGPFERRGRVVAPSFAAWKETGRVLAELVGRGSWEQVTRSLVNDVLLAMTCREAGLVLVTRNVRDFRRIAGIRRFEFTTPWPAA